ncbi:MAG: thioredoxin [Candidatus Abawacabacteria bacterium RBG_16_42_10]|uniref:Thioredoxin n=1 Tax=Candidatus Abawacabacteria bacterium RBG_16_42_10 TaxID=1817814 RepID=A0A1F4XJZ6_9BACT|nr:MAG: thioredoxin [Candidatus Abawacabacteria bacterium RBG_16_42_10]
MEMQFTDANFATEVEQSKGLVIVDFFATWCGPCKQQGPIVEKLAEKYAGKIKIGSIDVDANPEFPGKYGVFSIPTLKFFKDGKEVETLVGFHSDGQLEKVIEEHNK